MRTTRYQIGVLGARRSLREGRRSTYVESVDELIDEESDLVREQHVVAVVVATLAAEPEYGADVQQRPADRQPASWHTPRTLRGLRFPVNKIFICKNFRKKKNYNEIFFKYKNERQFSFTWLYIVRCVIGRFSNERVSGVGKWHSAIITVLDIQYYEKIHGYRAFIISLNHFYEWARVTGQISAKALRKPLVNAPPFRPTATRGALSRTMENKSWNGIHRADDGRERRGRGDDADAMTAVGTASRPQGAAGLESRSTQGAVTGGQLKGGFSIMQHRRLCAEWLGCIATLYASRVLKPRTRMDPSSR